MSPPITPYIPVQAGNLFNSEVSDAICKELFVAGDVKISLVKDGPGLPRVKRTERECAVLYQQTLTDTKE
ncbi:MAG: hypothetical protein ACLFSB_14335 [Chitinispirillaceae bacterium]